MKILIFLILLIPTVAKSQYDSTRTRQPVSGYGYEWINGKMKTSFVVPKDTMKLARVDSGAIAFKNNTFWGWNGYSWAAFGGASSRWSILGNSGTVAGTNFLGTTDSVRLDLRTNNTIRQSITGSGNVGIGTVTPVRKLDVVGTANVLDAYNSTFISGGNNSSDGDNNVAIGIESLNSNTSGNHNVATGFQALNLNTLGSNNVGIGNATLYNNITGDYNVGIGYESLLLNTGSSNIGIGALAGQTNTTQSNRLYINSLDRTNILGDTTKSIIYGYQDATASNQRLYLNSQLYLPYAASGVGTKALRINPSTGIVTYADTTAGGGGSQTWQQTLTSGSTLTGNNTIDGGGYNFKMNGTGFFSGRYDGTSTVTLANGGIAFGTAVDGKLTATGDGTAVIGYTQDNNAEISGTGAGSLTIGYANDGSKILNTANGSFVGGMAYNTGSLLKTSAEGSFVWGGISSGSVAVDTISNTGYESVVFGHGKDAGVSNLINEGNRAFVFGGGYTNSLSNVFTYGVGSQQFLIDGNTGNVGIGTPTPTVALDIIGAIKATDSVSFTGLLPKSASTDSVVVRDTNGKLGTVAKSSLGGSGTVTSVATGYGLSGGTITSTGTLIADSSVLMTKGTTQVISGLKYLTGGLINTTNGAASTPASRLTGTWFTGGTSTTTKPQLLIEPAGTTSTGWNTGGTGLGVNAASGFTGNLIDAKLNNVTKFKVDYTGNVSVGDGSNSASLSVTNGDITGVGNFKIQTNGNVRLANNTGYIIPNSDGVWTFANAAATDYGRLNFGGSTSSFPAIARNGTGIDIKLADNSAYTGIQSLYDRFGSGSPESVVTAPIGAVYHRTDGGAGTSFYVKESGTGNTGWIAK